MYFEDQNFGKWLPNTTPQWLSTLPPWALAMGVRQVPSTQMQGRPMPRRSTPGFRLDSSPGMAGLSGVESERFSGRFFDRRVLRVPIPPMPLTSHAIYPPPTRGPQLRGYTTIPNEVLPVYQGSWFGVHGLGAVEDSSIASMTGRFPGVAARRLGCTNCSGLGQLEASTLLPILGGGVLLFILLRRGSRAYKRRAGQSRRRSAAIAGARQQLRTAEAMPGFF